MRLGNQKILITGKPGVGKTTLVRKIIAQTQPANVAGFYTSEIRHAGIRQGFELRDFSGRRRILAHVQIDSLYKVGKYGVDKTGFEKFLKTLDLLNPDVEIVVIDEIGKMELCSDRFRKLVLDILNSNKPLIVTISLKGDGLIREIKQRHDIQLFEVTKNNRNKLQNQLLGLFRSKSSTIAGD